MMQMWGKIASRELPVSNVSRANKKKEMPRRKPVVQLRVSHISCKERNHPGDAVQALNLRKRSNLSEQILQDPHEMYDNTDPNIYQIRPLSSNNCSTFVETTICVHTTITC